MRLVRLPKNQRGRSEIESAQNALIAPFRIMHAQLGRTPFIAGEGFSMGDIPLGIQVHRCLAATSIFRHWSRWRPYAEIRQRPPFQRW